jgi:hypothetical protein
MGTVEESTAGTAFVSQTGRGFRSSPRKRLNERVKATMGMTPKDPLGVLESLIAESDLRAFDMRRSARWWGRTYYVFGLPAAVLATIAGATGLASTAGRVPAAIIALISAGLTAAATFLNSEGNRKANDQLSACWQELADDARVTSLQWSQKLDNAGEQPVFDWDSVLSFHRRKGRLLRGDTGSGEQERALGDRQTE